MDRLRLCDQDPIVEALRDTFRANIARVPSSRIQPFQVLARSKNQIKIIGGLEQMLDPAPRLSARNIKTAQQAEVSRTRSRKVGLDLGVGILSGILKGFGLDIDAGMKAHLKGA